MPKFLIEVPHQATKAECLRAIEIFLRTGSHFLTHADWGCADGEHKAWIVIDVENKDAARAVVPAEYRKDAKITGLTTFTMQQVELLKTHPG